MQKKTDKFLDKIVKKDYNDELEKVLEKKLFDENTKSMLLSILYKIQTAYKDYEKVKPNIEEKEDFIQSIIDSIKNNCDHIKVVKLNSKETELLGERTFLVEKNNKRIICYPVERKLLYCIAKINNNKTIIKDKYSIINQTLTDLINVGNNINMVEPIRDFNGYSWTTIPKEIESMNHNLVYQNIRILVGHKFLSQWITNNEFMIDYFESFQNKLEKQYGKEKQKIFIELLNKISVLLSIQYNKKIKSELQKEKSNTEKQLQQMLDNQKYVQEITNKKRKLAKEIKQIDETLNNKDELQKEYEKRNEFLPLKEKIFSVRLLSKLMTAEREEKIKSLEELNKLLNPQKFVEYKKQLEEKEKYLKLLEIKDITIEIKKSILDLQKIFLLCYKKRIEEANTKTELLKLIYEFRYYNLIPFEEGNAVRDMKEIKDEIKQIERLLIEKAQEMKLINSFSKDREINFKIAKNIFKVRIISLEDLYIKVIKEKEKYFVQLFDDNVFEEKIELKNITEVNKKDLFVKTNKKVKIFN